MSASVFCDRMKGVVEKAIGSSTPTALDASIPTHTARTPVVAKATSTPLPPVPPSLFNRGNQRSELLLSSSASPLHLPLRQWHKFLPQFPCLPGADETLNGGLMKSQGLSCGLITLPPLAQGGPPPRPPLGQKRGSTVTNCRASGQARECKNKKENSKKWRAAHVSKGRVWHSYTHKHAHISAISGPSNNRPPVVVIVRMNI